MRGGGSVLNAGHVTSDSSSILVFGAPRVPDRPAEQVAQSLESRSGTCRDHTGGRPLGYPAHPLGVNPVRLLRPTRR